jgi:4-hydroxy-3-polyprenylbenzoate decarboxylase
MYSTSTTYADLDRRGLLRRVREAVSDLGAAVTVGCASCGRRAGLLFEKPVGFEMPWRRICSDQRAHVLALGASSLDAVAKDIDEMMTPKMPAGMLDAFKMLPMLDRLRDLMPKTVRDAPCQEIVRHDGSLDELPILKTWPEDGGRYITFPLVITKDPETVQEHRPAACRLMAGQRHALAAQGGAQHIASPR